MMRTRATIPGLCAAAWLSAALTACGNPGGGAPVAENHAAKEKRSAPADLSLGPVSAFEDACARCHGPQGMFYGKEFAQMGNPALAEVVHEMMIGPGQLRPTEPESDAMTAYHAALRDKTPFAAVVNAKSFLEGKEAILRGERLPGAKVFIRKDGVSAETKASGVKWSAESPPPRPFEIVLKKGDAELAFPFPDRLWIEPGEYGEGEEGTNSPD